VYYEWGRSVLPNLVGRQDNQIELSEQEAVANAAAGDVITVDVFDTILLRRAKSEVYRQTIIAKRIAAKLTESFPERTFDAETIRWTRISAQRLAFRAREAHGYRSEVCLTDICERQALALGLPASVAPMFIDVELDLEAECLHPNNTLITQLRAARARGVKVIAISDTTLSEDALTRLINRIIPEPPLDAIYSSAAAGETKRGGGLFAKVKAEHGLGALTPIHIGDDWHADVDIASTHGFRPLHVPRSKLFKLRRRVNGGVHMLRRQGQGTDKERGPKLTTGSTAKFDFGRDVFGPLLVEYSLQLWMYLSEAGREKDSAALFCARGGLLMRVAYETFLARVGLSSEVDHKDFMVSRLIASRGALANGAEASINEVSREFADDTIAAMADQTSGKALELGDVWNKPVTKQSVQAFLTSPDSEPFKAVLREQDRFFEQHTDQLRGSASRCILVDTGLFGSTAQLLQASHPAIKWDAVQLARSNYKGFATPHFKYVTGLWTENNGYSNADVRSSILRYWQLIESIFEPDLQSVTQFRAEGDEIVSNLEREGWRDTLVDQSSDFFKGALAYLEAFEPSELSHHQRTARRAWAVLKREIILPDLKGYERLDVGERSRDFGRDDAATTHIEAPSKSVSRFKQIKTSLWRSGAAVILFPRSYRVIQAGLNARYALRWMFGR